MALDLAVKCYLGESTEPEEMAGIVRAASAFDAFLRAGTIPDAPDPSAPRISIANNGETLAVLIDGETVATITHAQAGHEGMRAVEQAAVRVAHALGGEIDGIDR